MAWRLEITGIIKRAEEASTEMRGLRVEEERNLWKNEKAANERTARTLEDVLNGLEEEGVLLENEREEVEKNGSVTIGSKTIVFGYPFSVGEYINYDPTVSDKNGTKIDDSKLTYVSPYGEVSPDGIQMMKPGNFIKEQTFKATSDIKWQILDVDEENEIIKIICENPILPVDDGSGFHMHEGTMWLFGEGEVQKACSLFGYGYGADTTLSSSYTIGGLGEESVLTINNTGARMLTIDDINKLIGVTTNAYSHIVSDVNGNTISSNYMDEMLCANNNLTMYAKDIYGTNVNCFTHINPSIMKYTLYYYSPSIVEDSTIRELVFKEKKYWLNIRTNSFSNSNTKVWRWNSTYVFKYRNEFGEPKRYSFKYFWKGAFFRS